MTIEYVERRKRCRAAQWTGTVTADIEEALTSSPDNWRYVAEGEEFANIPGPALIYRAYDYDPWELVPANAYIQWPEFYRFRAEDFERDWAPVT